MNFFSYWPPFLQCALFLFSPVCTYDLYWPVHKRLWSSRLPSWFLFTPQKQATKSVHVVQIVYIVIIIIAVIYEGSSYNGGYNTRNWEHSPGFQKYVINIIHINDRSALLWMFIWNRFGPLTCQVKFCGDTGDWFHRLIWSGEIASKWKSTMRKN